MLQRLEGLIEVPNWLSTLETRARVRAGICQKLDKLPQEPYPEELWGRKVEDVWGFVLHRYGTQAGEFTPN